MNKLELIETIEELGLDTNDFYVLSSGALATNMARAKSSYF